MYFKIFNMNSKLEQQLKHSGFIVNSYEKVSSYVFENDKVEQSMNGISIPKDYKYDDSIWREVELIPFFEKCFCLMRQPELSFNQLWELYISSSSEDDEIGSICIILNKYNKELLNFLSEILSSGSILSRQKKKKIDRISKLIRQVDTSIYTKKLQEVLLKLN